MKKTTNESTQDTIATQTKSNNSESHSSVFSEKYYSQGEVNIEKTLQDLLDVVFQKTLNKVLIYFCSSVLVSLMVIIWHINSSVSELEGKNSSPEKFLEIILTRLDKLEKENKELISMHHKYVIEQLKYYPKKLKR